MLIISNPVFKKKKLLLSQKNLCSVQKIVTFILEY